MHSDDPQQLELLRVCRIGRAQGLKGEVTVQIFTDEPEYRFAPGAVLYTKDGEEEYVVESSRTFKNRWIIKFEGIDDRDASEAANGVVLYGEADDPEEMLEADEWYPKDLISLEARLAEGNTLGLAPGTVVGKVVDVIEVAQWLLKIRLANPVKDANGVVVENSALVPFVDELVPDIDLEGGYLTLGRTHSGALIRCFFNKALAIMPAPFSYAPRLAGVPVLWSIMKIDIVSVFPEYFEVLNLSLLGKAQEKGLVEVTAHNLRDWTHDVHHSVDDTPVGGGAGMVMKPEVWSECLDELLHLEPTTVTCDSTADADDTASADAAEPAESATEIAANADTVPATDRPVLIFPNPSAPLFTQQDATELSHANHLLFGCGRYEGYDARIPQYYRAQGVDVREYSIGDYVLNGGEVAVSVMLEAITRLLPGFMGNAASIVEESYTGENALLEHRQYTKPADWRGIKVPDVLLSGDHAKVDRFRRDEALAKTNELRPDLIEALDCSKLDKADRKTLMALGWEVSGAHPRQR